MSLSPIEVKEVELITHHADIKKDNTIYRVIHCYHITGFMPNGPKVFQTSIGDHISCLIFLQLMFFGASFFSA